MTTLADLLLTLSYTKHCTSLPHLTLPCPKRVCLTPSPPPHRTIRHDTIRIGTTCRTSTQNKARPPTHPATHPQPQDTTPRQGTARHSTLHFTVRPPHDTTQDNARHGTSCLSYGLRLSYDFHGASHCGFNVIFLFMLPLIADSSAFFFKKRVNHKG